jgi:predicted ATP-grasp superfamily ATP-dependent carboligase
MANAPSNESAGPPGRVLVTYARSLQSLAVARSLGSRGVEVIGCDQTPMMALSFSRYAQGTFLTPPRLDDPQRYIDELVAGAWKRRPEDENTPYVLMPIHEDTPLVAQHRHRFEPWMTVTTPPYETFQKVLPKNRLIHSCRELGAPIPPTWLPTDEQQIERAIEEGLQFPAMLKLPDSAGSVGIETAHDPDELRRLFADMSERYGIGPDRVPLLQPKVGEDDYCCAMILNQGQPIACMTYRNLRTFPRGGGFGLIRQTVEAPKVQEITADLLGGLGWHGVAQVDFRWDGRPESPAHVIEVNPRFWGGLFQSVESGLDFPWLLYQLFTQGQTDEPGKAQVGKTTKVPGSGVLAALEELVADDERFEQLRHQHWDAGMRKLQDGAIWDGLTDLGQSVGEAMNLPERMERVRQWWQTSRQATGEIIDTDDPLAALGVLYIVGSLIRTGRLPQEVRRSGAKGTSFTGPEPPTEPAEARRETSPGRESKSQSEPESNTKG